ncbi:c-type cytochrome [Roseibium salinum]|uniref:Cytochrome c n=1 Tax=Roseibium salinum TaxID=1604349 RepID=A0ABT3R9U7_9HYPH|nr:cytochrome c [Roseibium sp. DSM 29163]MCX2725738.1 cytochrome c [Roseibium sp. DSM 29163]
MTRARKTGLLTAGALVVVAAGLGFYVADRNIVPDQPIGMVLRPDDAELVRQGAAVYAQNCASCHGADLQGEPDWQSANPDGTLPAPPHDETGHTWHHPDELLFRITKFGTARAVGLQDFKSNMPAFEGTLSDDDIAAALSWIKAQWPDEIRERHDMMNARARNKGQ